MQWDFEMNSASDTCPHLRVKEWEMQTHYFSCWDEDTKVCAGFLLRTKPCYESLSVTPGVSVTFCSVIFDRTMCISELRKRRGGWRARRQIKSVLPRVHTWSQECWSYDREEPEGKRLHCTNFSFSFQFKHSEDHYFSIRCSKPLKWESGILAALVNNLSPKSSTFVLQYFIHPSIRCLHLLSVRVTGKPGANPSYFGLGRLPINLRAWNT